MIIIKSITELQKKLSNEKVSRGFIPTMGALHTGHISLVQKSLEENDQTIVSIFINPTQFDQKSDLDHYPQTLKEDTKKLEEIGVDILFLPDKEEIYHDNYSYQVGEDGFSQELCGQNRPGHFNGVLTVVLKLLNLVQADRAYFGKKDFQQYKLIQGMVQAFFISTEIIGLETIRENDGLAMSSRNLNLSQDARDKAPLIYQALLHEKNLSRVQSKLEKEGFKIDYLEEKYNRRFIAAIIENTRLIDNVEL